MLFFLSSLLFILLWSHFFTQQSVWETEPWDCIQLYCSAPRQPGSPLNGCIITSLTSSLLLMVRLFFAKFLLLQVMLLWISLCINITRILTPKGCVAGRTHFSQSNSLQSCGLCSPPVSYVHGILQARILEWVASPFSRGSFWPRDGTCVSYVSCIGRQVLYH